MEGFLNTPRRRPFSQWHQRNIEGLLHSPFIGADRHDHQSTTTTTTIEEC
jgi:hypothetical protein